jgi:streptomycin 3"-adenylyltransferase
VHDPAIRAQLDAAVSAVRDTLGPIVDGILLHGSAVGSGLRRRSDVDLLVAAARRTTRDERLALAGRLLEVSNRDGRPGFERPIELTILVAPDVRPWRYPPPMDFQYGEWLRAAMERGDVEPEKPLNPDVAILLTSVLGASLPLVGPPAAGLFDPVPPADLRRAMTDELPSLLADLATDTRNIVLTLARVWVTLATGEIRSKDKAADWAIEPLPAEHRPVLERARAIYLDEEPERWGDLRDALAPFADHLVDRIRAASRADGPRAPRHGSTGT